VEVRRHPPAAEDERAGHRVDQFAPRAVAGDDGSALRGSARNVLRLGCAKAIRGQRRFVDNLRIAHESSAVAFLLTGPLADVVPAILHPFAGSQVHADLIAPDNDLGPSVVTTKHGGTGLAGPPATEQGSIVQLAVGQVVIARNRVAAHRQVVLAIKIENTLIDVHELPTLLGEDLAHHVAMKTPHEGLGLTEPRCVEQAGSERTGIVAQPRSEPHEHFDRVVHFLGKVRAEDRVVVVPI